MFQGYPVWPSVPAFLGPEEAGVFFQLCTTLAVILVSASHEHCKPSKNAGVLLWCCSSCAWVEDFYQLVQILYQTTQLLVFCVSLLPLISTSQLSVPKSVIWWPSQILRSLILPFNWGLPISVQIFDDITLLCSFVSTCIFNMQLFFYIYSHVAELLKIFFFSKKVSRLLC